jgi:pimeloyl-ACP methyl ester carboxylesterase
MFEEDIRQLGYPFEVHSVQTADHFVLTLFRIQSKRSGRIKEGLQPILMTHGLDEVAHVWIINSEDKALALVLADRGFDVWLLNNRGTAYSRHHLNHSIESKEIWDFSFQEMGEQDIPATLDYIHHKSNGKKVIAIGHSQGTTQIFAAMSDPQTSQKVQNKLLGLIGMSPVPHLSDLSPKTRNILDVVNYYVKVHGIVGLNYPFLSSSKDNLLKTTITTVCDYFGILCESLLSIPGLSTEYNQRDLISKIFQILPGGASFRCYLHYEQLSRIHSDRPVLRKYDYGSRSANLEKYGTPTPPDYNFELIDVPVFIHSGSEDILATEKSLDRFVDHMLSLDKEVHYTIYDRWDHFSVLLSQDPSRVFKNVLHDIEKMLAREHSVPSSQKACTSIL